MNHTPEKKIQAAVEKTMQTHSMVRRGDKILLAVSGGPDSIALSRVFLSFQRRFHLTLGIAHVNHQLRGEAADRDQYFVKAFAEEQHIAFHCLAADVKTLAKEKKLSIEEAGRSVRYHFLEKTAAANGYNKIATGHTKDDNAEQVLISLLRGSGAAGLSGIPPVREKTFIRPLIETTKPDLISYLDDIGQPFCKDVTNDDPSYLRNRIRHDLIPHLQKNYNPAVVDTLDRLSRILSAENDFLDITAQNAFRDCLVHTDSKCAELKTTALQTLHPAIRARVIRQCILDVKSDLRKIGMVHLSDIEELIIHAETGKHLDLPGRTRVYKKRETIRFQKEDKPLRQIGAREKDQRKKAAKLASTKAEQYFTKPGTTSKNS